MAEVQAVHVDDVTPIEVASGIVRRTLPQTDQARAWLIEFAPGSEWPSTDHHTGEERYFVVSGEIIEGDQRYRAGTYVVFSAGTSHRPRTDTGARILGINLL